VGAHPFVLLGASFRSSNNIFCAVFSGEYFGLLPGWIALHENEKAGIQGAMSVEGALA